MPPFDMIIFQHKNARLFSPHLSEESIALCEYDWFKRPVLEDRGFGFWDVAIANGVGVHQKIIGHMRVSRSAPLVVAC